ncbi:enoyl-CoA hydratase [Mannheimia haemolytica]|uniref:enoyl-CoA hydratase n=1 Tax=Mannheimia haemolytica TaxID=75985 RepID=UPI00201BD750|nr:enoyl-CoA hydratase [Mannheimia haemolytica]UQX70125.1 enoyl-CoA hydratase [Mannheimia haemolytica]UQX70255.1 enoyl-CoA hydratase [Mannheimia haemolytica]
MYKVYLALYKGSGGNLYDRFTDWIIRKITKGKYSHCEIAVQKSAIKDHYHREVWYECYSSSPRDGGVRQTVINLDDGKWDLIELPNVHEQQIKAYFSGTEGKPYDWRGVLGIVLGIKQKRDNYFCSEWCFNLIKQSDEGWRFSPNQLAVIFKKG